MKLQVGLKEWAVVCDLLLEGRTAVLLRKGGIHERGGPGVFSLEHPAFLLFPSWEHQKAEMIREPYRSRVEITGEPEQLTFHGWGEVTKIWRVPDRGAMEAIEDLHVWTPAQIDMRFNYKPENPLYVVAVRAYRLASSVTAPNHWTYSGCKSWVPLKCDPVETEGSIPAVSRDVFEQWVRQLDAAMSKTSTDLA